MHTLDSRTKSNDLLRPVRQEHNKFWPQPQEYKFYSTNGIYRFWPQVATAVGRVGWIVLARLFRPLSFWPDFELVISPILGFSHLILPALLPPPPPPPPPPLLSIIRLALPVFF